MKTAETKRKTVKPEAVQAHQALQPEQRFDEPKDPVGTSLAGLVGGTISLGLAFLIGFLLKRST
jgi:hypothetical protein